MSDTSFRVDTVPTPRLDLYGALTKDLQYYMQNKQTLPPSPRSALAAEQEKINKYMQYVNQSEGLWQQDLAPGKRSLCQALFLPNRTAGSYAVEVLARVDMGSLQVSPGGAHAAGYAKLKTTQQ